MASLIPHSEAWYDRLSTLQTGYHYPWRSALPENNGEDDYLDLVDAHLSPDRDVLDAGCGHGEVALDLAPRCGSVVAYDRCAAYIDLAEASRVRRNITNVTFILANSSAEANDGRATIPADDDRFDLLISRRGPLNWVEDARRVARPGAVLIQLNPMDAPVPSWNEELPESLRFPAPGRYTMRESVVRRLALGKLELHSCWSFEVPEVFPDPQDLYDFRAWGFAPHEVPAFDDVRDAFESIFARHAGSGGVAVQRGRFLWKAVVD